MKIQRFLVVLDWSIARGDYDADPSQTAAAADERRASWNKLSLLIVRRFCNEP